MSEFGLLHTTRLTKSFGGVFGVKDVSIRVEQGRVHAIIGPNGSGKSTFINLVSGIYKPTSGTIRFAGEQIAGMEPHLISRLGLVRTFQNLRLFRDLSVLDNVILGAQWKAKGSIVGAVLRTARFNLVEQDLERTAREACDRLGLAGLLTAKAGALSYGQQRRVEIARALAANPKMLLIDEPVAGMNSAEAADLRECFHEIREDGITILLIEHNMPFVMKLADRISVFDHGELLFEGTPEEVQSNPLVINVYLGKAYESA